MKTVFFAVNHGKCENVLCDYISMWLRIRVIPVMMGGGSETISLHGSADFMSAGIFRDMKSLNTYYKTVANRTGLKPKNLRKEEVVIFVLADVDGDGRSLKSFRSKDLFRDSHFCDNIFPIATNPNLDEIFRAAGISIGERGKPETYRKLLDKLGSIDALMEILNDSDSDIPTMIKELMKHCPSFQ